MERVERLQYITQGSSATQIKNEIIGVLEGGCKWVQLRMKDTTKDSIVKIGKEIKPLCHNHGAKLIINDSPEICEAIGADGVHLGKSDISTAEARRIIGSNKIIGRTCNTANDVESMAAEDIDYIGLGPLRFTTTKKLLSPIIGLEGYKEIVSKTTIPIVAVGGITTEDITPLLKQGVYGVALSGTIAKAANITETTKNIITTIERQDNE